jgi:hypothetical protein
MSSSYRTTHWWRDKAENLFPQYHVDCRETIDAAQAVIVQCSPYMRLWNTKMCRKSSHASRRAMLYHFKNVFLFLFSCCWRARLDGVSTGKNTTFLQCIEHFGKHSTIQNSAHRNPSMIFFNSSNGTTIRSHKCTAYQHIRHLWRCAAFFTALLQCHYQQSQWPTDASHWFTCFRQ